MKQQKRHRTNFISGVIALVTLGLLVLLAVALYKHTELEVRFDALISWDESDSVLLYSEKKNTKSYYKIKEVQL